MSWFYDGCYLFDNWVNNYEQWLYDQVCTAMVEGDNVVSR